MRACSWAELAPIGSDGDIAIHTRFSSIYCCLLHFPMSTISSLTSLLSSHSSQLWRNASHTLHDILRYSNYWLYSKEEAGNPLGQVHYR